MTWLPLLRGLARAMKRVRRKKLAKAVAAETAVCITPSCVALLFGMFGDINKLAKLDLFQCIAW